MSSMCSTLRLWMQPWKTPTTSFVVLRPGRNTSFGSFRISASSSSSSSSSSSKDDSASILSSSQGQLNYDPSDELFGLGVSLSPRDAKSSGSESRPWFGPNGQYIKELPCPSCRGRGFTQCPACGIERPRQDCSECTGKGMITCDQCSGDCVIWDESVDERPWEKAHSSSPFKVKEDDDVDNLDLQLEVKKKSKREYRPLSPEVGLKISRSLKSLNAKTGIFSKRMKIIHRDPVLRAQRVAAIKKAKGTPAARKHASETMKAYFSNPENRRKRSFSMLGSKYKCSHCGGRGHRRHYCPERKGIKLKFRCKLCGEEGHNRTKCPNVEVKVSKRKQVKRIKCAICGKYGHNQRSCPQPQRLKLIQLKKGISEEEAAQRLKASRIGLVPRCKLCGGTNHNKRTCGLPQRRCTLCGRRGHYRTTCPAKIMLDHNGTKFWNVEDKVGKYKVERRIKCAICSKYGHTKKTCPQPKRLKLIQLKMGISEEEAAQRLKYTRLGMIYGCTLCGKRDHNKRTCGRKTKLVPRRKCSLCGKVGHNRSTCILNIELDQKEADSNDQGFSYSDHGRTMSETSVVSEAS